MTSYIALIHKDVVSDYGVSFPDFAGCVTAGRTVEEARRSAAEALALHMAGMVEDGHAVPEPSSLDAVMHEGENSDAVAFLVDVPVKAARAVRLNIMLPEDLVQALDRAQPIDLGS